MIRLLDIPGAPQLEARLELCPDLTAHADGRTRDLLRTVVEAMGFTLDFTGWIETPELLPGEDRIDVTAYGEAEEDGVQVEFWRGRGWDIAGRDGKPLHIYPMVFTAMLIIEEARCGFSKMKLEAGLWRRERDRTAPVDPKAQRQSQSFLQLGQRGRRARTG